LGIEAEGGRANGGRMTNMTKEVPKNNTIMLLFIMLHVGKKKSQGLGYAQKEIEGTFMSTL
jgi:hypothetical protein